ncbi:MAG: aminotransferase class V-fold PLP-dependent enzyme [Blastocatellia bacterium]|nr:aminotransferase class V-fold PLP-dependent enzyme [Blastocatellia bacterium]
MIYLDNAATSHPKPENVYVALGAFLRQVGGNPGRGGHWAALEAEKTLAEVRLKLARLIGAPTTPERVVFTFNASDGLNMAIKGVLEDGDHVITSGLEHNSVMRPLARLQETRGIEVTVLPFDARGLVDPDDFRRAITPRTRLMILSHASNVIGTVQPIEEIGAIARENGLLFLVDAAQTMGVIPVDVKFSNIDLLAAAGHKGLMGPPGTGFLYVGERAELTPWREGGTGGNSLAELQPMEFPYWLESGTPNTVGIAALGAALEYLTSRGIEHIHQHEMRLLSRLAEGLCEIEGISIFGPTDPERGVGVLSFTLEGFDPQEIGIVLDDSFGVAVRPGLHCAPATHHRLGTLPLGTVRVSPGAFNTEADIDVLLEAVQGLGGG